MDSNKQNVFSSDDSMKIKGIAIVLMMFHHCFGSADRFEAYTISFFPFSTEQFIRIASSFKICVSLFAFITAYGLTQSLKASSKDFNLYQWYGKRFFKLFSGYWFAVILMSIICEIFGHYTSNIFFQEGFVRGTFYFLLQFFGLSSIFGTPMLIGTWWYMGAAVVFVLAIPLIWKIAREKYGILFLLTAPVLLLRVQNANGIGYPGVENALEFMPGHRIKTIQAFYKFVQNVITEKDLYHQDRKRINDLCNRYQDNHNCQRLLEQLGL